MQREKHPRTSPSIEQEKVEDAALEIEVSKDQMKAYIAIIPPKGGKMMTLRDILRELSDNGVVHGVDEQKIAETIENQRFNTKVEVASGTPPQPGINGQVIYHFDTKKELKPKVSENGTVDYYNLDLVTNVTRGQLLAQIIPPTRGIPGMNVLGKELPTKDGKPAKVLLGKGVSMTSDGLQIYSDIDGQPHLSYDKLSVLSVFEIQGDVGPATGNIDFLGTVIVRGNVKGGFSIKAEGDIEINGTVEDSTLEAKGNILLKRGMQGRGKGEIKAGNNVIARYVENAKIEAGQDVIISEAVMHSIVLAGRRVELQGRKGLIVGGACRAGEEVIAKTIGSPMATYTEIEVGINPGMKQRCMELNQQIDEVKESLLKVNQALSVILKKHKMRPSQDKETLIKRLKDTLEASKQEQNSLLEEKQALEEKMQVSIRSKVSCSNSVFPGVNIIIGSASMRVRDKIDFATFYNYEGHIRMGPYEGK